MRSLRILGLITAAVIVSGCASIVSHSTWPVTVNSSPPGIMVKVRSDQGGVVHEGATPFTVTLKSGTGYFSGAAYQLETAEGVTPLHSSLNGWYFGNIIFGGLIGLVIVDPITGAMWTLPETVWVGERPPPGNPSREPGSGQD